MSTCVDHILRHDFHDLDNKAASVAFLEKSIEQLRERLRIKDRIMADVIEYDSDDDSGFIEYSFRIPNFDADIQLGRGFWKISQALSLDHMFSRFNGIYSIREDIFDIARALDAKEAWHCSEYISPLNEEDDETFDSWMKAMNNRFGAIQEFNESDIDRFRDENKHAYYAQIVHDSFQDCHIRFRKLKERFEGYTVLNLGRIVGRYAKLHSGDGCYLADAHTGELLLDYPVDDVLENICGAGMIIQKGARSAFFSLEGRQMSEFVSGEWRWKWAEGYSCARIVYNAIENLKFVVI